MKRNFQIKMIGLIIAVFMCFACVLASAFNPVVTGVAVVGAGTAAVFAFDKQSTVKRLTKTVVCAPLAVIGLAITDGTVKQNLSIQQQLHALLKYGIGRYLPVLGNAGAIDVSGQTTEVKRVVFVAQSKCYVKAAKLISSAALDASDTNYVTITLKVGSVEMAATAKTTKSTGGAAIVANTLWAITVDQGNTVEAGEAVELSVTPSTESVANDLANVNVALAISYDEDDCIADPS